MKKHLNLITLTALSLLLCTGLNAQSLQATSSPYLDSVIQAEMLSEHIPGLSACIVKEGEIRWVGTYGYAYIELDIPVDTSTLFRLASISKTPTVTALMQLWEENLFEMDDDINDYTPFEIRNPNDTSAPITFKMLCTHTSAIQDNWGFMPVHWGEDSPTPLGDYLFHYLNPDGAIYNPDLNFYDETPGTRYHYSNIGAALIGYMVEVIGDSTFSYQSQENIFEPLQMNETAWFLSELDTMHIAMPYKWNVFGYTPYGHYGTSYYPAGQLRTSSDQLANFLLCYMNGGTHLGEQVLQDSTVEMILTLQVPQINPNVGLIWHRWIVNGREYWGHSGGFNGVRTNMLFCPDENAGVVILSNGEGSLAQLRELLFDYASDSIEIHCLPEGITFNTQEEIDSFQSNHPYCTDIEGDAEIKGDEITSLNGLSTITSIRGDLKIDSNCVLYSLEGLGNLTMVEGDLWIYDNNSLTSLEGLHNIVADSVDNLHIFNNNSLSTCEVESICFYLAGLFGEIEIHDNAAGCNSREEVEEACWVYSVEEFGPESFRGSLESGVQVYPNPFSTSITLEFELSRAGKVNIEIFNHLSELIDMVQMNCRLGKNEFTWKAESHSPGIYFIRLQMNEKLQIKKIIKL